MAQQGVQFDATTSLRKGEAESANRYRMLQLGQKQGEGAAQPAAPGVEDSATPPGIGQLLEQLIRQISVLSQKVAALEAPLGLGSERMPAAAPAMQ